MTLERKVSVTEPAAAKAQELLKQYCQEHPDHQAEGLRIGIKAGGCSGFQYSLTFDKPNLLSDTLFEEHGLTLIVDSKSLVMLAGTVVDYVAGLQDSGFKITNPNAKSSCGCGKSFA